MKKYSKPEFRRAKGVSFVLRAIRTSWQIACRQCASCHGCR